MFCLLGLPFDAISMKDAVLKTRQSVSAQQRLFLSTPNLNFLIASQSDKNFRQSVINSDLSVADGMPLIWVAKLLGYPIQERVAGSDLFQQLQLVNATGSELKIFFFGGAVGVAEAACEQLKKSAGAMTCVGYSSPGFGSIEDMSSPDVIEKINNSHADFLLVALGAKKGQAWIEYNRKKISAPIISHLGAVVNFVAGTVKRAPVLFQKLGIEWLWRIFQEPKLWRRYFHDGVVFIKLLILRVLPHTIWRLFHDKTLQSSMPVIYAEEQLNSTTVITITGVCTEKTIEPLRSLFTERHKKFHHTTIDLTHVPAIDGAFLGLCLILDKYLQEKNLRLHFTGLNAGVGRVFYWSCAEYMLSRETVN